MIVRVCGVLLCALWASDEPSSSQAIRGIDWSEHTLEEDMHGMSIVADPVHGEVLKITNSTEGPLTLTLATWENPGITHRSYRLHGFVKYEQVSPAGHLEMWSHFRDGNASFTKTLAESGPLGKIDGTSNWRETTLPFFCGRDADFPVPRKLVVNIVLPGQGTVMLSDLLLTETNDFAGWTAEPVPGVWWSSRTAVYVGSFGGALVGLWGAAIGILAGFRAGRPYARWLTLVSIVPGIGLLVTGVVALIVGQPYAVWYPLLLGGGLLTLISPIAFFTTRQRIQADETLRMQAMDAQ